MNKVILLGRLVRDPEVRYSQGDAAKAVARYTVAVDRKFKREGEPSADFISCVAFGKLAEFAEKYFSQSMRVCVSGHIQTGSYTNKDGNKVYTTDVIVEEQEFAQSKNESAGNPQTGNSVAPAANTNQPVPPVNTNAGNGFVDIPDGIDMDLPFN